jgi:hypothetical protein
MNEGYGKTLEVDLVGHRSLVRGFVPCTRVHDCYAPGECVSQSKAILPKMGCTLQLDVELRACFSIKMWKKFFPSAE